VLYQIFTDKDSFCRGLIPGRREAHSPTNTFQPGGHFLAGSSRQRERTHLFFPSAQQSDVRLLPWTSYFNGGSTGICGLDFHAGQPFGAVVVGGGTTLQWRFADHKWRHERGKQSQCLHHLSPRSDQVKLSHGKHFFTFVEWLQRLQANDILVQDQYGQIVVHQPARFFMQGRVSTYTYVPTTLRWDAVA